MSKKLTSYLSEIPLYKFGRGARKVVITAGIHGDESSSIYLAFKIAELAKTNPPQDFEIVIFPVLNFPGFSNKEREWYGKIDLNRYGENFFKKEEFIGSYFKKLTNELESTFLHIDLHNFTKAINGVIIYLMESNPKNSTLNIKEFLASLDFGFVERFLFKDEPHAPKTLDYQITKKGVQNIIFEFSPFPFITKQEMDKYARRIYSSLEVLFKKRKRDYLDNQVNLYAPIEKRYAQSFGIFFIKEGINPTRFLKAQAIVGNFLEISTGKIKKIKTAKEGYLQHIHTTGQVAVGEEIYVIAKKVEQK